MSCRMNASAMKIPPPHQLVRVSRLAAWRVPTKESEDDEAPPNEAERPPPLPACMSTAAISTTLSRTRRTSMNVYILEEREEM